MEKSFLRRLVLICAPLLVLLTANPGLTDELVVKSCSELMRLADSYRDDYKAADLVLGSAIDMGDMERVKNYKIKRAAAKKKLELVVQSLEIKGCVKPR